jgi:tRNA G18 (ribose-2'-O)-methylase SpoU
VLLSRECADAYAPKCVRAGMGAQFRLRIHQTPMLSQALDRLSQSGYAVVGASIDGDAEMAFCFDQSVIVIGSEAHGLSMDVAASCTQRCRIPMTEGSESLNAAVAGGIMLYRQYVECIRA